ncbi:MAG: PIN domain-containing protein, partial [Chloroflexi bacterium]|nr:PIN domain-containing protein [Chloroflexota bacterium]
MLDSSALLAYLNRTETAHPLAKHLMRRIEDNGDPLHGHFSVVSASELLVRPYRVSTADFTFMHKFLTSFPNLTALPIDLAVASSAAIVRAITNLRLPDAIIVASGLMSNCEVIISNDEAWKRKLQPLFQEFNWLYLGDYI